MGLPFISCMFLQVVSFLRRTTSLQLPFKIEKDKVDHGAVWDESDPKKRWCFCWAFFQVGGFSVKGSHFDQERWTKVWFTLPRDGPNCPLLQALKFMLLDLKYLIAVVESTKP